MGTPAFQGWKDGEDPPGKMEGARLGGGVKILRPYGKGGLGKKAGSKGNRSLID